MPVRVQTEDFDLSSEVNGLRAAQGAKAAQIGGIATFIGTVRDINDGSGVSSLTLEHYPGMTEKALEEIVTQAKSRWDIFDALVVHRVGTLHPQDQIVLVVTLGAHRGEAFAACEFIMDFLKTQAPFWKKEVTPQGDRWVEAKVSDDDAAARWQPPAGAGAAPAEAPPAAPAPADAPVVAAAPAPADAPPAAAAPAPVPTAPAPEAAPVTPSNVATWRFSHNTDA